MSMAITVKQISSLEKVRKHDPLRHTELHHQAALAGQRLSYQIAVRSDDMMIVKVSVESALCPYVQLFSVRDAVMDDPVAGIAPTEDYITQEPGLMPDILVPLSKTDASFSAGIPNHCIWVRVDLPRDLAVGTHHIRIRLAFYRPNGELAQTVDRDMELRVIPAVMPEQQIHYTRWIYLDCIATAHNVEIFSEAHWQLIEKYIAAAADLGINMLLVPVHTPPLDTQVGTQRPCVQLVDIEKVGSTYRFSFKKFHRYICLCKKYNIRCFEIAHMYSQWGAKFAPNILVTENGRTDYRFGWHTASDSADYVDFLKQYISAIRQALEAEGISDRTYFHISDEPNLTNMESYKAASRIIRPLIGSSQILDAISNFDFYAQGLMECPVTDIQCIHDFLPHNVPDQWAYYCCNPRSGYPNSFLAQHSYLTRLLGFLMYKYQIKGFLHWGLNYYNACRSMYPIDPYMTTSGDGAYPSGDPFILYPGKEAVYASIRGEVTFDAIQDMKICYALEQKIGREKVVNMIDEAAGFDLRFDHYPRSCDYLLSLRERMLSAMI